MTVPTSPIDSDKVQGMNRRAFLGWTGRWSVAAVPGAMVLELVACGGSDSPTETSPVTETTGTPVLENPASVSISIQARQVQWVPGKSPVQSNAWVYVADGMPATTSARSSTCGATACA